MRYAVIALLLLSGQAVRPSFEVVSVKRNTTLANGGIHVEPGGRFVATSINVFALIAVAYGETMNALRAPQIVGAPRWLQSENYDITAKATPADMDNFDRTRLLLRTLLEDRFKLRAHREQRAMPIYALVRARPDGTLGPNLRQSIADCSAPSVKCGFAGGPRDHIKGDAVPMAILVQLLANVSDRIVVDRTGLTGGFQIDLEYSPDQTASDKPSIFSAVNEQLGLKLEATRGPVDVVVVDHVERPAED